MCFLVNFLFWWSVHWCEWGVNVSYYYCVTAALPFFPLVPLSYWVLCGSIYFFSIGQVVLSLSADVLLASLWLKVYLWGIHGERCIPHHLLLCHLVLHYFLMEWIKWNLILRPCSSYVASVNAVKYLRFVDLYYISTCHVTICTNYVCILNI